MYNAAASSFLGTYCLSETGYSGFEDEILRVRNVNRPIAQTRQYLDWRYSSPGELPEPIVFWIRSKDGRAVGMASLIFRSYWANNRAISLGVLGDISLDSGIRGRGFGRCLLEYVRQYLEETMPGQPAFVIPNEAAEKSLISAGWKTAGALLSYVLPIAPLERLSRALRSEFLGQKMAWLTGKAVSIIARSNVRGGYEMQLGDDIDDSFAALWHDFPKANLILSDRGIKSLTCRYVQHPHLKFHVAKLFRRGVLIGYLIFSRPESNNECHIYDLLAKDERDILCLLGLFLMRSSQKQSFGLVRIVLNDRHPYAKSLWKLGFIPRHDQGTFLTVWPDGFVQSGASNWSVTLGDKDV